jgi:hypothetical protein
MNWHTVAKKTYDAWEVRFLPAYWSSHRGCLVTQTYPGGLLRLSQIFIAFMEGGNDDFAVDVRDSHREDKRPGRRPQFNF